MIISKIKILTYNESKMYICPFKNGDIVSDGSGIYPVYVNNKGEYFLIDDSFTNINKIKPKRWDIYKKIKPN